MNGKVTRYQKKLNKKEIALFTLCALSAYPILLVVLPFEMSVLLGMPYSKAFSLLFNLGMQWPYLFLGTLTSLYAFFMLMQTGKFYITENDIRYGLHSRLSLKQARFQWADICGVKWNQKNSSLEFVFATERKILGMKSLIMIYFPLNKPEAFKADIIKYVPEGHPLREWVESEEFTAIHNQK